ncbi:MFS DHA1 transporter [Laccaria bicolor S238N-H82]|uniref:MFS DHA1 transporter n=1 Tax=Laccaria bicolor (strain S238N-H82 / ATCC MYA-4686) TaxID=486041 RepID=B0DUI4_LACBS|nr:MFS DHA1 transporter [Laccaria bicolor S238N-H82]EDR01812.1 MFS DHA1 transporter [Laccaria bicolor S238N-H82]|eukprot:XP_001887625.1 MFS DHA1 transporter [Laccaria bicolor S238N-H82]
MASSQLVSSLQETDEKSRASDIADPRPTKEFYILPIPTRLRYNPELPFKFTYGIAVAYAVVGTLITANLYYCQPLLIEMSKSFHVSYDGVARIPTFLQAGYAVGILLICPLGDLLHRRQLTLLLVLASTLLTFGLTQALNLVLFESFTFLAGLTNVSSQILIPLVAEIAPPSQRSFAYSIVLTGMLLGILLARIVAGIVGQFVAWRMVYYTMFGLQCLVVLFLYFFLPDYPPKPENKGLTYGRIFWTMAKYAVTEPVVIQVIVITIGTSAAFSSYWVTMTFLLGGKPYYYSTLGIGLFGIVGLAGVIAGPLSGRIVDRIMPWYAILISTFLMLLFQAVHTAAGGIHISAVIISSFGLDFLKQIQNVGLLMSMFSVSLSAGSRLNALFVLSFYVGQIMGTSVGTMVFVRYGWRASSALGMGWYAMQILVLLARGPHCKRYTWVGYEGGASLWRMS